MGARPDTRARSLLGRIACSSRGGSGEGPGRENSLASLGAPWQTPSVTSLEQEPPVRDFRSLWVGNVAAFEFSTLAAAGVLAR
jgi:hypothetical protein